MPRRQPQVEGQQDLFPASDFDSPGHKFKELSRPLWTERKAALVARYLHYFVFVTHHGTYIDAFAGRQSQAANEGWAAEEVLKNKPDWMRKFYLFEQSPTLVAELEVLRDQYPNRKIQIVAGDSNTELPRFLPVGSLGEKEASFCLLDQRTFECSWATCQHVAAIKPSGYKVEQFYFLGHGWLDRAFSGIKTTAGRTQVEEWWGRDDWETVRGMGGMDRARLVADRFRQELGYSEAYPWPIYASEKGTRVMYYMIHATDHPAAAPLMRRAYEWAVAPVSEDPDQLALELQGITWPTEP